MHVNRFLCFNDHYGTSRVYYQRRRRSSRHNDCLWSEFRTKCYIPAMFFFPEFFLFYLRLHMTWQVKYRQVVFCQYKSGLPIGIENLANNAVAGLMPVKFSSIYEKNYVNYESWRNKTCVENIVLLAYFKEESMAKKSNFMEVFLNVKKFVINIFKCLNN